MARPIDAAWDKLTTPKKTNGNFFDRTIDSLKTAPTIGPAVAAWDYLLTDKEDTPDYRPSPKELEQRGAFRESMEANRNRAAMDALREQIASMPSLSGREITQRARREVMPIFRPQIRSQRRLIGQTERQGRQSARQVQSYYNQAGSKVAGIAQGAGKANKKAIRKLNSGGVKGNTPAGAETRIAAKAMGGMGKANASFFKQMQGALAGEGAVAAADTRRNYKDLANEYRSDLAEIQANRASALQAAKAQIRKNIRGTSNKLYENIYLGAVGAGNKPRQAQKAAMALARTKSGPVQRQLASTILSNRGNESALLGAMALQPQSEAEIEQANEKTKLGIDQLAEITKLIDSQMVSDEARKKFLALALQQLQVGG